MAARAVGDLRPKGRRKQTPRPAIPRGSRHGGRADEAPPGGIGGDRTPAGAGGSPRCAARASCVRGVPPLVGSRRRCGDAVARHAVLRRAVGQRTTPRHRGERASDTPLHDRQRCRAARGATRRHGCTGKRGTNDADAQRPARSAGRESGVAQWRRPHTQRLPGQ